MAPDKIFLQVCGSCNLDETCENCEFAKLLEGGEVTWSEDRIYEKDEEYIRKDALLEWLKMKTETAEIVVANSVDRWVTRQVYKQVMNKLNSM